MTEKSDEKKEISVFPSTVVSRNYQKYRMEKENLKAIESDRFIVWDDFTALLRSLPENKTAVQPLHRRIFIEQLIEHNIRHPFFKKLIPLKMAPESRSYRAVLQQALTELPVFAADKEAFVALSDLQSDLTQMLNLYRVFLEKHKFYEPDLEHKLIQTETKKFRIFYPEVLPDFKNYQSLFDENVCFESVSMKAPLLPLKQFASDVSEIRFVFSEIEKLLQAGEPVENIAIACIDAEYHFLLQWFSFLYQIPLVIRKGKKVGDYPSNRLFFAWFEAVSSQFSFSSFQSLFFDPLLPWKSVTTTDRNGTTTTERVCELLMKAFNAVNVVEGAQNWKSEFRKSYPQAEAIFDKLQKELCKAVKSSSFSSLLQNVQDFLKKWFDDSQRDESSRAVYQRALTKLRELSETEKEFCAADGKKKLFETISPFEFWLKELENEIYVEQDSGAKITVYNGKVACGAPIAHLFVIGINESSYRFVSAPFGFLSDFDREEIRRKELREVDRTDAIYRLYSTTPGSRVTFTGALTVRGESRFTPSLFLVADAVETVGAVEAPAPEKIDGMPNEAHLRRYSRLFPTAAHAAIFRYNPQTEEGITLAEEAAFERFSARVTDKETGLRKISVSSLEKSESCPFSWFLSRYNPEAMKTDLLSDEANQFGTLVHSVVEFYINECAAAVNAEENPEIRQQTVNQFLNSFWERLESDSAETRIRINGFKKPQPILWEAWRQNTNDYIRYFAEADRVIFPDSKENLTEIKCTATVDDELLLDGRIDRVIKTSNGYYFLDYKTGKLPEIKRISPTPEERAAGAIPDKFQIAAYAFLAAANDFQPLAGSYYYAFKNNSKNQKGYFYLFTDNNRISVDLLQKFQRSLRGKEPQADIEAMKQWFLEAARRFKDRIDARIFRIQPSDDACRFCEFATVCRKDFGIKG